MGTTRLCVATEVAFVRPLAAVRGFVFGDRPHERRGEDTVCSWRGPRLAPLANLPMAVSTRAGHPRPADSSGDGGTAPSE